MGDAPLGAAALANAVPQREDVAASQQAPASTAAGALHAHGGGILASYLRTVLQAYVNKHAQRAPSTPPSSPAAGADSRPTKPPQPPRSPLPARKPLPPADRLVEFNSKWNWLKGCRKAARLGKGLGSQAGESALLLQCEHWLEASDPKHRYGSHLRPYYTFWLHQQQARKPPASCLGEDFFFWLDEGSGRAVDLVNDGVPRDKLEAGRVRYLTYEERERCEVLVGADGLLRYKRGSQLVHTYEVEETLDDIHMRHSSRASLPGGPAADHPPHPSPQGLPASQLYRAGPPGGPALIQLKTTASTPAPGAAVPQEHAQQQPPARLRRTASAPGDGTPMDGMPMELDGLPPAQWLVEQQQQELGEQQEQEEQQQQQPAPPQQTASSSQPQQQQPEAAAAAAAAPAPAPGLEPGKAAAQKGSGAGVRGAANWQPQQPWNVPGPVAVHGGGKKEKCGWIYVMDTSCRIYVHRKKRGQFHHSSFLSGAAVLAAGGLEVRAGHIEKLSAHSGHYRPDEATFQAFLEYLKQQGADLRLTRILGVSRPKGPKGAPPTPTPVRTALLMRRNSV